MTIKSKVSFNKHISNMQHKAKAKLSALSRVAPFMKCNQKNAIMDAYLMHNLTVAL